MKDRVDARSSGRKYHTTKGRIRKWYGNQDYVVNWEDDGEEIRNFTDSNGKLRSRPQNTEFFFNESVSWSKISSSNLAMRFFPYGFIFDVAGCSLFSYSHISDMKVLGVSNTMLIREILAIMSPTLNFEVGQISNIPYPMNDTIDEYTIEKMVRITKDDWDSYETSWDFQQLPLLQVSNVRSSLKEAYEQLREQWIEMTLRMQELEEENNRIFIEAYGLEDELTPDVPLKEITLTCNPYYRYGVSEGIEEEEDVAYSEDHQVHLLLIKP